MPSLKMLMGLGVHGVGVVIHDFVLSDKLYIVF